MKSYEIAEVPNPLCRRVSVPKELREMIKDAIKDLPFIDDAQVMHGEATQIHVLLSPLAEECDLEAMEILIIGWIEG